MYTLIDSPNSLTDDSIAHHMSKKAFHPIEKIDFLTKSIDGHMHFRREMDAKKPSRLKHPHSLWFLCQRDSGRKGLFTQALSAPAGYFISFL